nr:hypothetical protein [Tanacetum cinerariifolium]
MSHLSQLAADANSIQLTGIMALLFYNDNQRDCQLVWETYVSCQQLMVRCQERHEQTLELQSLVGSNVVAESVRIDDSTKKYSLSEVNYDGVFRELPLRNSLEIGLTIVEGDPDIKKMCDMNEMYGLINLYITHLLRNLAAYYFRNLSFDDYHRDMHSKLKIKNLYADFLNADCADDHFDPLDYWKYKDVYRGGCFDVGGFFKGFDWIYELVGSDDHSLSGKSKDEFSNDVILDDVVSSLATTLSLLLKMKGENDCSIRETASMNNDSRVDVSSLGGLGIKEVNDLEVRNKNLEEFFFNLRNRKVKQKDTLPGASSNEMYMEEEEVVFKIHTKGYFEYDPLRYLNGLINYVSAFNRDKDVFPRCLNHILSENGSIHLHVAHKKQNLWKYYYKNMEWEEDDTGLRCCSSTPFDTRFKRNINKSKKIGVIHDEGAGRKREKSLVNGGNKGKEKVFEDEGADKRRKKTLVTGGKLKMVEVVGVVKTRRDRGVVIGGKEEVVSKKGVGSRKMHGTIVKAC